MYKMTLNPEFSCVGVESKLSFHINAFNGNTTNFNRCPKPTPKTVLPVQPRQELPMPNQSMFRPMIRPM